MKSEYDLKHVVLHSLVGRWHLTAREDTTVRKMSEMYQSAFKLPSIRTRNVLSLNPMATQTIRYRAPMPLQNVCSNAYCHRTLQTRT
ncbi:hypothetical protein TNCV_3582431 [Trichonephila clavipes]|nr:hypothetical protein TNCV_3582431 [Trichonephila clavipes]